MNELAIDLRSVVFGDAPRGLARDGGLTATAYRYSTGVAGLRITNGIGHIDVLPFQGQQIWDAQFFGRSLTMKSMFPEPLPTLDYLATYGAFFIHCGASAMGNPGPQDSHPVHGELPNALYQEAELIAGRDGEGNYMGLRGVCRQAQAFKHHYEARPAIKLYEGSGRIRLSLEVQNLRPAPMDFMYLAHINFRPHDGAVLIDTAPDQSSHMRIRTEALPGFVFSDAHQKLLQALRSDPSLHRKIGHAGTPEGTIAPELVIAMDCRAGKDGWAHCLQLHPNGAADFVSHRPEELPHAVRWMTRTGDQEALGMLLPATAEPDGYTAEKAKGNVRVIPPMGSFNCQLAFGALQPHEAQAMQGLIGQTRKG